MTFPASIQFCVVTFHQLVQQGECDTWRILLVSDNDSRQAIRLDVDMASIFFMLDGLSLTSLATFDECATEKVDHFTDSAQLIKSLSFRHPVKKESRTRNAENIRRTKVRTQLQGLKDPAHLYLDVIVL